MDRVDQWQRLSSPRDWFGRRPAERLWDTGLKDAAPHCLCGTESFSGKRHCAGIQPGSCRPAAKIRVCPGSLSPECTRARWTPLGPVCLRLTKGRMAESVDGIGGTMKDLFRGELVRFTRSEEHTSELQSR